MWLRWTGCLTRLKDKGLRKIFKYLNCIGWMRTLSYNQCYVVKETDRGDIIFGIVGMKDSRLVYIDVAEVPFHLRDSFLRRDGHEVERFIGKATSAIRTWFASPPYESLYRSRAERGLTNPKRAWGRVKKHFDLSSRFDKK